MRVITRYACEICGYEYETTRAAHACEARGVPTPVAQVGDIVTCRAGFGWFDGDRAWISNFDDLGKLQQPFDRKHPSHGNCFASCCTYLFYYVVTAITPNPADRHELHYHLATKAMTAETGWGSGWTTDTGSHYTPRRVEPQPVLDTQDLIGRLATSLL